MAIIKACRPVCIHGNTHRGGKPQIHVSIVLHTTVRSVNYPCLPRGGVLWTKKTYGLPPLKIRSWIQRFSYAWERLEYSFIHFTYSQKLSLYFHFVPFRFWERLEYSFIYFTYSQKLSLYFHFVPFRFIHLHFPILSQPISNIKCRAI